MLTVAQFTQWYFYLFSCYGTSSTNISFSSWVQFKFN